MVISASSSNGRGQTSGWASQHARERLLDVFDVQLARHELREEGVPRCGQGLVLGEMRVFGAREFRQSRGKLVLNLASRQEHTKIAEVAPRQFSLPCASLSEFFDRFLHPQEAIASGNWVCQVGSKSHNGDM